MQNMTLVYYGNDSEAARAMLAIVRDGGSKAFLREAGAFDGEAEDCASVVICDDVTDWLRGRILAAYPGKVDIAYSSMTDFIAPPGPTEFITIPSYQPPRVTQPRRRGRPPGSKNIAPANG